MISVPILDSEGKTLAQKELQEGGKISHHAIKTAVIGLQTHQRQGNASTKTRAEVSGSGKKPWKQKGTGRARAGERTSPVWRGGGVAFGPRPHDFNYRVNHQVLKLARDSALRLRLKEGKVILVRDFKFEEPRTKLAARVLKNLKLEGKTLVIVKDSDSNMLLAFRNLPQVDLIRFSDLNAYEILTHQHIVFTEEAFEGLSMKAETQS